MFKQEGHLASFYLDNGPLVSTILQKPGYKLPTIIAYALAKLSRNPLTKTMAAILEEVMPNEDASTNKMETIVGGYGHTSVTGMGHLTCTLENISILNSMTFFYLCRQQDGQETSTRYVDFSKGDAVSLFTPPDPRLSQKAQHGYYKILEDQIQNYRDLIEPTTAYLAKVYNINQNNNKEASVLAARTFDCLRYLIPLGTKTKVGAIQSAREWSKYIKQSNASENHTQLAIGQLLHSLLTTPKANYTPEADILIRHTGSTESVCLIKKLMGYVNVIDKGERISVGVSMGKGNLVPTRLAKLIYPNQMGMRVKHDPQLYPTLFEAHSHHNEMGPLFQEGANTLCGALDIGSLKDINRHRSLEIFIPFLHEEARVARAIKETKPQEQYLICPYLDPNDKLYWDYKTALNETYEAIQRWLDLIPEGLQDNCVKNLVPQAHLVQYEVSGSLADWSYTTQLRVRNGGHIAYRQWAYEVAKCLAYESDSLYGHLYSLYGHLLMKLSEPNVYDRDQFIDRS